MPRNSKFFAHSSNTVLILFIYLFLATLGLRCCAWAFSSCGEWGLLFVAVRGLLIAVASRCRARALGMRASVVVAHGLSSCGPQALERRLSSCGTRAQLFRGMWDLPRPGLKPVSPALAGGFLTTAPSGKSSNAVLILEMSRCINLSINQVHSQIIFTYFPCCRLYVHSSPPASQGTLHSEKKAPLCILLFTLFHKA